MYTLEDDHETSSSLHKREIAAGLSENEAKADQTASKRFTSALLATSLKRLTTPTKTATESQKGALAALTIACIAVFFTALDQTVVVTALPQIINDLQVPITQLDHASWIVSAYLLGFIVVMPLMGRVSDIYGRRRIFLLCLLIFGLGSVLCGLSPLLGQMFDLGFLAVLHIDTSSPGLIWLIAARLFQAIGGGAIVPVAMAIAGDFYGQERRGLALGIVGAVTEAGGVLGPLYGAVVVERLGWQYIFYFNVPLVLTLIIAACIFIPKGKRLREGIDWPGAALLGLALTCLSLGLAQQGTTLGPANSTDAQNNPLALALAVVFLAAFVLVERKVRWPVVQLALFKRFTFSAASLVSLLVGSALIIAMADIPIFVDTVLQLKVLDSGLALLRLTAMIPVGALLGGWLCNRITCRFTGILGLLFTAIGFYLMSLWPIHVDWTQITTSTMTAGFGFGLVIAPIGTTAINAVRPTQAGMSSAIVTALRMLGMTLGLAALTSWALAYFKHLAGLYPSLPANATAAQFTTWQQGYAYHLVESAHTVYSSVFFTSMILCLLAIIPALFLWGKQPVVEEAAAVGQVSTDLPTAPVPAMAVAEETALPAPLSEEAEAKAPAEASKGNWWRDRKKRRLLIGGASILLVGLLIGGGILAAFMSSSDDSGDTNTVGTSAGNGDTSSGGTSGPRKIQLSLDRGALTSLFTTQLNLQQGVLSNLSVVPTPNDGLVLSMNVLINAKGIQRVLPVEMDGTISIDQQQNLQLQVQRLKRDGIDAGPAAAARMQLAVNQMLSSAIMPALHSHFKGVKLLSVHTGSSTSCGQGAEVLILQIEAPPIQGIAAQPTPMSFCLTGPIDLNKLLPH